MTAPRRPGEYRGVLEQAPRVVEPEPPRSLSPPPGEIQLRGNGWKASVPMAVLVALLSALGVKMLPAQSSPDAEARAEQRLEAMRNAEFREEMRRALASQNERQARLETELSSLRITVESTKRQVEKLEMK